MPASAQRDHGDAHVGRALCCVDPTSSPPTASCSWSRDQRGARKPKATGWGGPCTPSSYLGPHKAGWLAATGVFPERRGAACSAYLAGHTWPGMCWLSPLPRCPQGLPGCWWEEPKLRRLPRMARRANDSAEDGDSVESPQEAHAVTQCMSKASRPGSSGPYGPAHCGSWGFGDPASRMPEPPGQDEGPGRPGLYFLGSPPLAGPPARGPRTGLPWESALGRRPALDPQY